MKQAPRYKVRLSEVRVIGSSVGIGIFVEIVLAADPPLAITCNALSCTYAIGPDGTMTIYTYSRSDELVNPLKIRLSYGSYSVAAEITIPLCHCINSSVNIVAIHSIETTDINVANTVYFLELGFNQMRKEDCINTLLVSVNGLPASYLIGQPALRLTPGLYVQAVGGAARRVECRDEALETPHGKKVCVECSACVAAGCSSVSFSEKVVCLGLDELVRAPLVLYDAKNGNLLDGEKLIVSVLEKMLRVAVVSAVKLLELVNDVGPYLADARKVSYYAAVIEDLL